MDVSNPDKVMFPEIGATKADLIAYHERIGDDLLGFLAGSPLTLERHPDGIGSKGFLQKNASSHFPSLIGRIEVPRRGGTTIYPTVDSVEGMLYLVNQGTITFHPWTSRLPHLDRPDFLVLDLDPEQGDLEGARAVAHSAREVLERFGLGSTPVASGSKGFHLWVPLIPDHDFGAVSMSARALAGMAELANEAATTEFLKADRHGRVFVDWLRNRWGQSIAAPFGVRARPGAPVAAPLAWSEVGQTSPSQWTIENSGDLPRVEFAERSALPVTEIVTAAREAGVDLDTPFDRFGR